MFPPEIWEKTFPAICFLPGYTWKENISVFKKLFYLFQQSQLINSYKTFLFSTLLFLGTCGL